MHDPRITNDERRSTIMNRILVVLPNWFGETLFATPLLNILRSRRPTAYLATLGWPTCREVLLHNPSVNDLLDYDERRAHRSPFGKWRLIRALSARRFDTAFILRRSLSRSLLLALAGIPMRVGFDNAKSGWLLTHRVRPASIPEHKAFSYLPLLEAVGLSGARHPYEYTVSDEERRAARKWLEMHRIANGRPLVALHPGANWPHKRWPPERFAALGDRLVATQRAQVMITGGPGDVALAHSIREAMRQPATLLAGQTGLRQLGACLEEARLVVSNDTGVLHIAAALRRPIVALYGPTSPTLTGPLGDPQRMVVLHHADCCPRIPCYNPNQPAHRGMEAITVDEVYDAARQMLQREMGKASSGAAEG
ncbi:MAG: lipopolysaccharide heptosyltransferase II [Candidatus Omnitrophica bacterium]|nr:lipopolysaccharide heptosyltransferase II [Candidatus Omnitrophota bacterium]